MAIERRIDYPEIKMNIALISKDIEHIRDRLKVIEDMNKKVEVIPLLEKDILKHIQDDYNFYSKVDKTLAFQNKVLGALIFISVVLPIIVAIVIKK